jgi:thiol:disulfide interchange protein DsbA
MKKLLIFILLLVNSTVLYAADYVEGTHYKKVPQQPTSTGDKIEVLEFFWYGCPHCFHFEPFIESWNKNKPANVEFVRVPAVFRPDWEVQARTYYALSNMGVIEDLHGKIFEAIHKYRIKLNSMDAMADYVSNFGVNRDDFIKEYSSFAVDSMVRKGKKLQQAYKIEGVPAVVVNGEYLTSGAMSGSFDNLIKIINYLTQKAAKEK